MLLVLFTIFYLTVAAKSTDIVKPPQLTLLLNEEDGSFEHAEPKSMSQSNSTTSDSGCTIRVNGDLGHPQPLYIHGDTYLKADGNSGLVRLITGEQITVACNRPGTYIQHPNITSSVNIITVTCVSDALVSGDWLSDTTEFGLLSCSANTQDAAQATTTRCWNNNLTVTCVSVALVSGDWLSDTTEFGLLSCSANTQDTAQTTTTRCWDNNLVIRVGYIVDNVFHPLYYSCFNEKRMEVLYVWYDQTPENVNHQTGVTSPSFRVASFYPGVSVNTMYTQVEQKKTITEYVGAELAEKYITTGKYFSRGHIAAKTDFVFATAQRASFFYINVAPQWYPFNARNWYSLEHDLRVRISAAGYRTVIYSGTFGVTQLRDQNNNLVDIYLVRETKQIPVPQYFYKVVYDATRRHGTVFIGINNPYYTEDEVRSLTFCVDRCRNNTAFNWLRWQPDRIDIGYSFCCTVDDFRKTVTHLPAFEVDALLT